jgi:hypothetical protein
MKRQPVMLSVASVCCFLLKTNKNRPSGFLESDGLDRSPEIGPLPPRRSKLWSAVRTRDGGDILGLFHRRAEKSRVRFLSLSSAPRAMRSRRSALPPVNSTQRA